MKKVSLLGAILLLLCLGVACAAPPEPAPPPAPAPEEAAPPASAPEPEETAPLASSPEEDKNSFPQFTAVDIYGQAVDSGIFADYRLTMVNIWGTFCGPCIMEMPDLGELAADLPEGAQLIGLVGDALNEETIALAQNIAETSGANFTHIVPDKTLYDYLAQNIVAVPTTLFLDKDGRLVGEAIIGAQNREKYEAALLERLEQVAD